MLKQHTIAIIAVASLGTVACERGRSDTTTDRQDTVLDPMRTGDTQRRAEGERLSPEMQRRLDDAQERFTKLERQAADARRDLAARTGEARSDAEAGLERAMTNAKTKLEAARQSSAENARRTLDELDEAINDLDKRLRDHGRT
jgi:hypothetical protein